MYILGIWSPTNQDQHIDHHHPCQNVRHCITIIETNQHYNEDHIVDSVVYGVPFVHEEWEDAETRKHSVEEDEREEAHQDDSCY